ncbi:MAG: hypothetical protein Q9173_006912, partial [Seirophora scorigena]
AAANGWGVPVAECRAARSVVTHTPTGRTVTYGQVADAAGRLEAPKDVPLKDPRTWTIAGQPLPRLDTAEKLTGAQVYGIDLSPIQPRFSAPNVKYQVDDVEQPWTFPHDHFDYVHTRILYGSMRDWAAFFAQSFAHLRPGGYVECQEIAVDARADDGTLPPHSTITAWCANQEEAMRRAGGMSLLITGAELKTMMEAAGFVDVVAREFKIPIGQWPADPRMREAGTFQLVSLLEGISGLTMALWTRFLGWERDEVEDELAKVKAEFQRKDVHSYWPAYAVYGRKPLEGKTG